MALQTKPVPTKTLSTLSGSPVAKHRTGGLVQLGAMDKSHYNVCRPLRLSAGDQNTRGSVVVGSIYQTFFDRQRSVDMMYSDDIARRMNWNNSQKYMAQLIMTRGFEGFVSLTVALNICVVILETDARAREKDNNVKPPSWLEPFNLSMLSVFILELCLRIFVFRSQFFTASKWHVMDFTIIAMDVLNTIISRFVTKSSLSWVTMLRLLRVVRMLRAVRVVRTLTVFRELYLMLHAFLSALRAIAWATFLLGGLLTFWSIIAVDVIHPLNRKVAESGRYDSCPNCSQAFESVLRANLTFFKQIVAGDSWGQVSEPIIEMFPETALFFLSVHISIDLGLLNLILTVIVDRAAKARQDDLAFEVQVKQEEFEKSKDDLLKMCETMDTDNSGQLTLDELVSGYEKEGDFAQTMLNMDVHKEDMQRLFHVLDQDGSGGVAYQEFIEQLHKMKSQDLQMMLVFLTSHVKDIGDAVTDQMRAIKDSFFTMKSNQETIITRMSGVGGIGNKDDQTDGALPVEMKPSEPRAHIKIPTPPPGLGIPSAGSSSWSAQLATTTRQLEAPSPKMPAAGVGTRQNQGPTQDLDALRFQASLPMEMSTLEMELEKLRNQVDERLAAIRVSLNFAYESGSSSNRLMSAVRKTSTEAKAVRPNQANDKHEGTFGKCCSVTKQNPEVA